MVRLDSNKIEAPIHVLKGYSQGNFRVKTNTKLDGTDMHDPLFYCNGLGLGIKNITINENKGKFYLETSAKVLRDQYHEGININTIERVLREVNNTGIVSIDTNNFIDQAAVLRTDITDNIRILGKQGEIVDGLMSLKANIRFAVDPYKSRNNYGASFKNRAKSFRERLIIYHKPSEVLKDKELLKYIPLNVIQNNFQNVWRVESNYAQFRKIREYCNIFDTKLLSVLNSQAKVNYELFKKINKVEPQLELFSLDDDNVTLKDIIDRFGRIGIIEASNYEIEIIDTLLRNKLKSRNGNFYSERKKFAKLIFELQNQKSMEVMKTPSPIIETIERLLEAA